MTRQVLAAALQAASEGDDDVDPPNLDEDEEEAGGAGVGGGRRGRSRPNVLSAAAKARPSGGQVPLLIVA